MPERMRTLSKGQRRALAFAVLTVIAGMVMGFWSSFATLYSAAEAHRWSAPALLPLSVDTGIAAYVILDQLAVTLGARSRWLHVVALALAGFTVWMNAVVAPAGGTVWRVIHAAMPALWVLGVEALRFMWRRLHDTPGAEDSIPRGRWLAEPWTALLLWRRMRLLNVTSWPRMAALEDARLHIRDRVRAALDADAQAAVPGDVHRVIRSGRLPAAVLAAVDTDLMLGGTARMEEAASEWLDSRLTLRDEVRASLDARRRDIARAALEASPEAVPGPAAEPSASEPEAAPADQVQARPRARSARTSKPALKLTAAKSRGMTPERLAEHVSAMLGEYGDGLSVNRVKADLSVGTEKAKAALEIARKDRARVVQFGERKQA